MRLYDNMTVVTGDDTNKPEEGEWLVSLTQKEFKDLTRDLNLSMESDQLLGSCLKAKHLLAPGTTFYSYRDRERELRAFHVPR